MNNITELNTQLMNESYEVYPYPDYANEQGTLLGIYAVKASARFEATLPFACIIARSEEEVFTIALGEGISDVVGIELLGYALPKYNENRVVYINQGEYLHEHINN